jgi:predicted ArsR family transcriptional regulator
MRPKASGWTSRFFQTTRGQIVLLLRQEVRTVAELAKALDLTDNAIRAHLATLERDGFVQRAGERPGFRKPHFSYELTAEAEELFPKTYGLLLGRILTALEKRLGSDEVVAVLRDIGRDIGASRKPRAGAALNERLDQVLKLFEELGGYARIERTDGTVVIRSSICPLAEVTADHAELCLMLETLCSKLIGKPVRQRCERDGMPKCVFEVKVGEEKPHAIEARDVTLPRPK